MYLHFSGTAATFGAFVGLCFPLTCLADQMAVTHTFQTTLQSMWGPGAAFTYNYNEFYGVSWDKHKVLDAEGCDPLFGTCWGGILDASTRGRIGMDVGFSLNGGSVDAQVPAAIQLEYPHSALGSFRVSSSDLLGNSTFSTMFPSMETYIDGVLELFANAHGELCVAGCQGFGGDIIDFAVHPEFASFNRGGNGELHILGLNVPMTGDMGYISWNLTVPNINTSASGTPPPPLTSAGSSEVLDLNSDLVLIAANAFGMPPPSGSIGPVNYTLLSAGLGLSTGIAQAFSFMPNVQVQLDVAETGQSVLFDAGQESPDILIPAGFGQVHVTPTFLLNGQFTNDTDITFTPYVFAKGGEFGVGGIGSIGPLFDKTWRGSVDLDIFNEQFPLAFDSFRGDTFVVTTPEPGSVALVLTLILVLAAARWRNFSAHKA